MEKTGRVRTVVRTILFLALMAVMAIPVLAVEADEVPDLTRKCSLTVTLLDNETREPIQTGALSVIQTAEFVNEDGTVELTLTEAFRDSGLTLDDLSSLTVSQQYMSYAQEKGMTGMEQALNSSGSVSYPEMNPGLYLVYQSQGMTDWTAFPFLILLPNKNSDGSLNYDVDASPKVLAVVVQQEITDKPSPTPTPTPGETPTPTVTPGETPTPTPPGGTTTPTPHRGTSTPTPGPRIPQTGQLWWPVPVLLILGAIFLVIGFTKKKRT